MCNVFHVFYRISLCCAHFAVHELFSLFKMEVAHVSQSQLAWYSFFSV
jgi:hypothetical protein